MTISTEDREAGPYTCDGVDETFEFEFKVFAVADVLVVFKPSDGPEETLVLDTHYTVALNADQDNDPGGVVTTIGADSPYNFGALVVTSDIAETQGAGLPAGGNWSPRVVERALDKLTMLVQQVRSAISRSLRQPISDAVRMGDIPSMAERAGKVFAFDAEGEPIAQVAVPTSSVMATSYMETLLDDTSEAQARATLDAVGLTGDETVAGNKTFSGSSTFSGAAAFSVGASMGGSVAVTGDLTPAQIAATQDDYTPTGHATAGVLRISTDARRTITGLAGGADGRLLTVHNVGTFPAVFAYENTDSDEENRFAFAVTLGGGQSMEIQYDATAERWRCKAKPEPLGTIEDFAGSTLPADFLAVDQDVSRTTYAALFNEIGTAWGAGDGSTTFGLYVGAGRALIAAGTGTIAESVTDADITTGTDSIAVASNEDKWITGMQATWNVTGTPPTTSAANQLDDGDTVFIVRTGATSIKVASSLANAQNGTVIDITAAGSGTFTLTHTLAARTHGEKGGKEAHAMSSTEQLSHRHEQSGAPFTGSGSAGFPSTGQPTGSFASGFFTQFTGGNAAMNVMNPYAVVTRGIRYC